ncbi:immunoglobulin lambda-1 light chain-like [Solea senegalensis]|nr:immunoglobulin lambda-1 light chain-like [Solea senegalensis]
MISRLAALFLLSGESLICTAEAPVLVSVTVVKPGDNVNLTCPVSSDKQVFNWYKQPPGHMLHKVVSRILKKEIEQFIDEHENPEKVSGRPGQQATLQCSLVSKSKGNTVQCPGRDSVSLFRAGSGSGLSRPNFIYVHENSDDDDGTHRCAVLTCGNILFGEETKVETRQEWHLVVAVLGALLALCLIVIAVLVFSRH